jgi:Tfp pilus assembly protein FimT
MRNKSGFTITEALLSVLILGILAAVALPRIDFFGGKSSYIASRNIVSDLRYTRTLAVTSGTRHYLKLLPPGGPNYNSYEIYKDSATPVKIGDTKLISDRVSCSADVEEFKFSYLGVGATGSTNGSITLDDGSISYTIGFIASTGRTCEYKN